MEYTFTPGQMRVVIPVTISDDNVFEGPEAFIGMLATSHAGAIITVPMTTININDNDRKYKVIRYSDMIIVQQKTIMRN